MVGAENCRGECGGGLLVDITAEGEPALAVALAAALARPPGAARPTHHCVRHSSGPGGEAAGKC